MSKNSVTIDGQRIFGEGEHVLRPGSWQRKTIDQGFAGLDGVVSVDLGMRSRKLKQHGYISTGSVRALTELIDMICGYIDGGVHELVDQDGVSYASIRMDAFSLVGPISKGSRARCEYEAVYTQLSNDNGI